MAETIFLRKYFGSFIVTRPAMTDFMEKLKSYEEDELVLDFSDICFISRSAADEFVKKKKELDKHISETNMEEEVSRMISIILSAPKKKVVVSKIKNIIVV